MQQQTAEASHSRPIITTTWELWTYDVWGNEQDGFEVNDKYRSGAFDFPLEVKTYNAGTPQEFVSANPTDEQIVSILGINCAIETDGDDLTIYVNRASNGKPICELHCISHASLSPIKPLEKAGAH